MAGHYRRGLLFRGAETLMILRVVHPDFPWLIDNKFQELFSRYEQTVDPDGFARVRRAALAQRASERSVRDMAPCLCRVLIATAKPLDLLAAQDLLAYDRAMRNSGREPVRLEMLWGALNHLGIVKARAPTLKAARHPGPATVEELVDRYQPECRPVRDLLVQYVAERAPAKDHLNR
jgi:hypothetical protein